MDFKRSSKLLEGWGYKQSNESDRDTPFTHGLPIALHSAALGFDLIGVSFLEFAVN